MEVYAMASIRDLNGKLFFDFRYQGHRCRGQQAKPRKNGKNPQKNRGGY